MKRKVHLYSIPGTLTRIADVWCPTCLFPSLWEGPVWLLDQTGVDRWGWITGCYECDWWIRVQRRSKDTDVSPA